MARIVIQHPARPSVPIQNVGAPQIAGMAWLRPFEHVPLPTVRIDGSVMPWLPVAAVSTVAGQAWQGTFEHRQTPRSLVEGIAFNQPLSSVPAFAGGYFTHMLKPQTRGDGFYATLIPATLPPQVSGEAWQKAFEHRLKPPSLIDGPATYVEQSVGAPAVAGMAWQQAFDHTHAKPILSGGETVWRLSAAIPVPVGWCASFENVQTPKNRVDGSIFVQQNVGAPLIAGMAWRSSFEHTLRPPSKVDGPAYSFGPPFVATTPSVWWYAPLVHALRPASRVDGTYVSLISTTLPPQVAGEAWQKAFEHWPRPQIRIDGNVGPWPPVAAQSTIAGQAFDQAFDHAHGKPITIDGGAYVQQLQALPAFLRGYEDNRLTPGFMREAGGTFVFSPPPVPVSGEAWLRAFEHWPKPQLRIDGGIAPWRPIVAPISTIAGQAWQVAFDHTHGKPVLIDGVIFNPGTDTSRFSGIIIGKVSDTAIIQALIMDDFIIRGATEMINNYNVGTTVSIPATFSVGGVAFDPASLTCTIQQPDGSISDVSSTIAKQSSGSYLAQFTVVQQGPHNYKWAVSTGSVSSVTEGIFMVYP